ncbi:MAG TPA: MoaD/ThiS family protein [Acidobacteriaceae bacterium]|nr:MoaD/ThiS family protein [Acidobacteriaceae bacterium]
MRLSREARYSGRMRVTVLYFGMLKDLMGTTNETVVVPGDIAVRGLLEILQGRTSKSDMEERVWQGLAVAVNREYSGLDTVLREGDEVALLPPVSGGCFLRGMRGACDDAARTGRD